MGTTMCLLFFLAGLSLCTIIFSTFYLFNKEYKIYGKAIKADIILLMICGISLFVLSICVMIFIV